MGDSVSGDQCSSSTESVNLNDIINNKNNSVDDDRIDCSNGDYLDKIYEVAVRHVTELADSHLKEDKQQFIVRFSEVFKDFIEQNVTVNGLPWILKKETQTTQEKQEQTQETLDALLSKLSKTIERTAEKRKIIPKRCSQIYGMQTKHERQNLKRAKLESSVTLPSVSSLPVSSYEDTFRGLTEVFDSVKSSNLILLNQEKRLLQIQQQIDFANDIAQQHFVHSEALYDTGYNSE